MLVPSKFTRLEESTIFKMAKILRDRPDSESVLDLYHRTRSHFQDASEFLHAVDALYVLGILEVDELEQVNYA
ncbi:ABC-three component system middle component 7 [Delftia acidovorans]